MDVIRPGTRKVFPAQERQASGSGSKFAPGDTLFARITPCLENGKIAQYAGDKPGMGSTEFFVLRAKDGVSDAGFVYYFSQTRELRLAAETSMSGASGRQRAVISSLSEFECEFPPLPIQRRIAGVLSAYDELIENSQRRIKILEQMARSLYREWFVHFRYPGHESVPLVPSPLGEIPQGWELCELGDFAQFKSGFAFKSGAFTADGDHRLVTIKNVQDGAFNPESDSRISDLPPNLPPYCVLKDGDILLSLTGNVGRVCLVYDGPYLLNQRVSKLSPVAPLDWALAYCMFRQPEMRTKLEMLSNGVAQQNLSPVLASQMEFVLPPRELRQSFQVAAEPMVRSIVQLFTKIQNLRRTRDLLLPRLLSGQIDVEAMPS
jgi:type I restriction enzyme S subunit